MGSVYQRSLLNKERLIRFIFVLAFVSSRSNFGHVGIGILIEMLY